MNATPILAMAGSAEQVVWVSELPTKAEGHYRIPIAGAHCPRRHNDTFTLPMRLSLTLSSSRLHPPCDSLSTWLRLSVCACLVLPLLWFIMCDASTA